MKAIAKKDVLRERIAILESQQTAELMLLKQQFHNTVEQLNPLYFIKNAFKGITTSPEIKSDILHSAVTVTSNFVSKNTLFGAFQKPIKKIIGNILMAVLNKISSEKSRQL
ncbi:hypothetical protein [Flavobacterium sp.]|uniref:hypothetical protein n=1 Tax=Flavobacterium sp. TaxID=239 RepID=UPI002FDB09C6